MTTGIDIVKEGIKAAAGEQLGYSQDDVTLEGTRDRVPHQRGGRLQDLRSRTGSDRRLLGAERPRRWRVDSGVGAGGEVSQMYDPMVAKLIVWDADRAQATKRMLSGTRRI